MSSGMTSHSFIGPQSAFASIRTGPSALRPMSQASARAGANAAAARTTTSTVSGQCGSCESRHALAGSRVHVDLARAESVVARQEGRVQAPALEVDRSRAVPRLPVVPVVDGRVAGDDLRVAGEDLRGLAAVACERDQSNGLQRLRAAELLDRGIVRNPLLQHERLEARLGKERVVQLAHASVAAALDLEHGRPDSSEGANREAPVAAHRLRDELVRQHPLECVRPCFGIVRSLAVARPASAAAGEDRVERGHRQPGRGAKMMEDRLVLGRRPELGWIQARLDRADAPARPGALDRGPRIEEAGRRRLVQPEAVTDPEVERAAKHDPPRGPVRPRCAAGEADDACGPP